MGRRIVIVLVLTLLGTLSGVCQAQATGWPVAGGCDPALPFAVSYERPDGTPATHSGMDVVADAGEPVLSVDAGTVAFAGRIPSAAGGSMLCVTIETDSGLRWSYMPLADVSVAAGEWIDTGAGIGTVAATGDPSTPEAHVHVGLRQGDLYIDPLSVLTLPSAQNAEDTAQGQDAGATQPAEQAAAAVSGGQPEGGTAAQSAVAETPQPESVSAPTAEARTPAVSEAPQIEPATSPGASSARLTVSDTTESSSGSRSSAKIGDMGVVHAAEFAQVHVCDVSSSGGARTSRLSGTRAAWRLALAVFGLGPVACRHTFRWFRSRVTAPGDTVAAVVGR